MAVLIVIFALFCAAAVSSGSSIVVTPSIPQFLPNQPTGNLSFVCDVTGGDPSADREAVWTVLQRQILRGTDIEATFANIGIFVEPGSGPGLTELVITSEARLSYFNDTPSVPNITVLCSAFSDIGLPLGEEGDQINVTTFGPPLIPMALDLNPDPDDSAQLIFGWAVPADSLSAVVLVYTPNVADIALNVTNQTFVQFTDDISLACQPRVFSVFAMNAAGNGPPASLVETIPISPNISSLDREFQVTGVTLAENIIINFSFPAALSCNPNFTILNYSLSIPTVLLRQNLNLNTAEQGLFETNLEVPGLEANRIFLVFIEACISLTCRQSGTREFRTTDVQSASIVFFENNIFVTCSFAAMSDARGCVLQLLLSNGVEEFSVTRSAASGSQCFQTDNQFDAFFNLTVRDWEANGDIGSVPFLIVCPTSVCTILEDVESYTSLTGCSIPDTTTETLGAGAIVGIVIAALIVGAVVLGVVILLLVYRVRTGQWFKLREKDEEKLTVHFEKELLMGETKPKKKSKGSTTFKTNHISPDHALQGKEMGGVVADSALDFIDGTEAHDAGISTNPNAAFTLDISSDRRKARLHLNKALIKRVLHEKNINTMDRTRTRRQNSMCKKHLLPLHCEVRVEVDDE